MNPIDPVPYVAPSKLGGFKHAGTEIDPTYGITESAFYAQRRAYRLPASQT